MLWLKLEHSTETGERETLQLINLERATSFTHHVNAESISIGLDGDSVEVNRKTTPDAYAKVLNYIQHLEQQAH